MLPPHFALHIYPRLLGKLFAVVISIMYYAILTRAFLSSQRLSLAVAFDATKKKNYTLLWQENLFIKLI